MTTMKKRLLALCSAILLTLLLAGCAQAQGPAGVLTLAVNPEIRIAYDESGRVLSLEGANPEGERIVSDLPDYIGRDCSAVVEELIGLIHEAGYFVEEIEGEPRRIVLELEPGSALPREGFLEDMSRSAQDAAAALHLGATVATPSASPAPAVSPAACALPDDGVTDYNDTDYGPNADGVTDYNDTDYGPNADGDTGYGPATDYAYTDYGPDRGDSGYSDSGYNDSGYSDSGYGDSDYDD